MKIVVLCSDLGVRMPGNKGASLHLKAITNAYAQLGHQVLLVGVAGHDDAEPLRRANLTTMLLPHPGRCEGLARERSKLAFVDELVATTMGAVEAFRPDVIYERLSLFGTAGVAMAARTGALHVLEVNALMAHEEARWRGLVLQSLATEREAMVVRSANLRVAVSTEVHTALRQIDPIGSTIVVANGVEVDNFVRMPNRGASRAQFGIDPSSTVMVFTGALRPWHGLNVAISALPELPRSVELVVAGDGPVRSELEQLAAHLAVAERVRWLGHVHHGDIPSVLATADVALAPYPDLPDFRSHRSSCSSISRPVYQ
jgi:glycosyltransferase involved in cell wall biosynthesis